MSSPNGIYILVAFLWALTLLQGVVMLRNGMRFRHYVGRAIADAPGLRDAAGQFKYRPKAAVILPCCGVDERLHHTVEELSRQNYGDCEIVFTFESRDDPAYAAVGAWIATWSHLRTTRVVAGLAERRGQKVHNLLAALAAVSPDREVLVFLDSDAIPHSDWLGYLVAPLTDERVGAATGFRWYSAAGGMANGVRSCWNAASLTLITDEKRGFVWGGSTAIRRETFERLRIADHWEGALSDDYQVTRALHQAGLAIRFVPQALIPSHDSTDFASFFNFARRQLVITRVCAPAIWRHGFLLCLNFVVGGIAVALLFFAALFGWVGNSVVMALALAGWLIVIGIAGSNAFLRQISIRRLLGPPDVTWRDFWWDVGGVSLSAVLHLALMVSSATSRRIVWRHTEYELVSPDETLIVGRLHPEAADVLGGSARGSPAAGFMPPR